MQKDYSLSAVVLSKNSEKKIEKCLSSLSGWVDEIIVVDGGSIDETLNIARRYSTQIYSHEFLGSFAAERNFGTQQARCEWVLQLDSDEELTDNFKKQCDIILPKTPCAAFKFRRKNIFMGHPFKYGGWYHWSQHLFKRGKAHYEGRIHEKMIVDGQTGYIDAELIHSPFDSLSEFVDRQNRYTDLQARDIIDTEKKLSARMISYNLKIKPFKLFKKMYFNKQGYKEGFYGFMFAALFSWVHFMKWAKVWEGTKDHKNILIIRNDRFGEFLLNIPAVKTVRETFAGSKIILAVDPSIKELAKRVRYADEVISWTGGRHSIFDIIKFARMLRKKDIDICLVMNPSRDSNIAVFLAGIPVRVGYSRKWDFLLTKKITDFKYPGQKHEVDFNMDLVKLVGVSEHLCEESRRRLDEKAIFINEKELDHEEFFDNAITVHPWTSDSVKQWPEERFKELALVLARDMGFNVVIVGANVEFSKSALFNNLNSRIHNLTGKTTLVQLAAILKKSRLLISGDSGPVHLACAVGTPVIALFRNDISGKSAKRWGPLGDKNIVIEKKALKDISTLEVLNKVKEWKNSLSSIPTV